VVGATVAALLAKRVWQEMKNALDGKSTCHIYQCLEPLQYITVNPAGDELPVRRSPARRSPPED
jgi:hypothetical protein